jgi:hypothetical protein
VSRQDDDSNGGPSLSTLGVDRRTVLRSLGAAASAPLIGAAAHGLPGYHAQVPAVEPDRRWRPRSLNVEQIATAADLAEVLIPETDTPGARAALAHQHIDFELSRDAEAAQAFVEGLAWLDRRSVELYNAPFSELGSSRQNEIVAGIADPASSEAAAGKDFFEQAKSLTIRAYYRSEIGMRRELGYEGNRYLSSYDGCQHEAHHTWRPRADRATSEPEKA